MASKLPLAMAAQGGAQARHGEPFRFEVLPADVFNKIAAYLLGSDMIRLSHVNGSLFNDLLSDPHYWTSRLLHRASPAANSASDAKRQYMESKSYWFSGMNVDEQAPASRGAFVPVPTFFRTEGEFQQRPPRRSRIINHAFSMDMWFSLAPSPDNGKYDGGVLVGCQSIPCAAVDRFPDNQQQFVFVDTSRTLYCSMVGQNEVISEELQYSTWYHLAVTFDGGEQSVYLNGTLMKQTQGSVYHEWRYLHYTQLGTGYTGGASAARPRPVFRGWYAFHGLIDEFRLWKQVLSAIEVELVAKGQCVKALPVYALSTDPNLHDWTAPRRVHCSRPLEKVCLWNS